MGLIQMGNQDGLSTSSMVTTSEYQKHFYFSIWYVIELSTWLEYTSDQFRYNGRAFPSREGDWALDITWEALLAWQVINLSKYGPVWIRNLMKTHEILRYNINIFHAGFLWNKSLILHHTLSVKYVRSNLWWCFVSLVSQNCIWT